MGIVMVPNVEASPSCTKTPIFVHEPGKIDHSCTKQALFVHEPKSEHVLRQKTGDSLTGHVPEPNWAILVLAKKVTAILTSKGGQMAVGGHAPERS